MKEVSPREFTAQAAPSRGDSPDPLASSGGHRPGIHKPAIGAERRGRTDFVARGPRPGCFDESSQPGGRSLTSAIRVTHPHLSSWWRASARRVRGGMGKKRGPRGHARPAATQLSFCDFRFFMPSYISSDIVFRGLDTATTARATFAFFKKVKCMGPDTNTRRPAGGHGHPVGARVPSALPPPSPPPGQRPPARPLAPPEPPQTPEGG